MTERPPRHAAHDIERYAGLFASRTRVMRSSVMRDLMAITERPDVISLAGGLPDTGAAVSAGAILSAPVMQDAAPAEDVPAVREAPVQEPPRPERAAMAAEAPEADSSSYRPVHTESAPKTFDVAATRRRPVVFEEDDDLDVPDFLK